MVFKEKPPKEGVLWPGNQTTTDEANKYNYCILIEIRNEFFDLIA